MSAKDAAIHVLKAVGEPLTAQELTTAYLRRDCGKRAARRHMPQLQLRSTPTFSVMEKHLRLSRLDRTHLLCVTVPNSPS